MFIDETQQALVLRDNAKIVDAHLPLIGKLVWNFIKTRGSERFIFDDLLSVAYEAGRKARGTFKPDLGFLILLARPAGIEPVFPP